MIVIKLGSSVRTIVPGSTWSWMFALRVSALRSCTLTANMHLSGLISTPPTTQTPSTQCPRLYFRLPNLESSISTMIPSLPIGASARSRMGPVSDFIRTDTYLSDHRINIKWLSNPKVYNQKYFVDWRRYLCRLTGTSNMFSCVNSGTYTRLHWSWW